MKCKYFDEIPNDDVKDNKTVNRPVNSEWLVEIAMYFMA